MTSDKTELSVVIGSKNARSTIVDCLSELERQSIDRIVELIIVDNSADGTAEIITKNFPNIKLIESTEDKFIPELWEIGINLSSGEIIAITTAHSIPDRNWVDEILKAHDNPAHVGIGGAIENADSADLVDWAVYFCRYSPYMLPFSKTNVKDIAADNASYKKSVLDKFRHLSHQGFWESRIHSELIKCGYELLLTPDIVVYHKKSFDFISFIKQRFWHGRQFGILRGSSMCTIRLIIYILFSPLIPFILLSKLSYRVIHKKRNLGRLLLSSPILSMFLLSWSLGELSGYLSTINDKAGYKQ